MLTHAQIQQFKIDGYLVLPNLICNEQLAKAREITRKHLQEQRPPYEFEADVRYPGAPSSVDAAGGRTIRRLKMAYQRAPEFTHIASNSELLQAIQQILGGKSLLLNPNHHNCVMTKLPQFSSETHWHRDTRYWHFNNKYLVNAWCALGNERKENGCMKILPGSHRWDVRQEALDEAQFLIPDHPDNQIRLSTARLVTLNSGDVLLFSAHCFHAAGKNHTKDPKLSIVFTYHNETTTAIETTKSSLLPPINQEI